MVVAVGAEQNSRISVDRISKLSCVNNDVHEWCLTIFLSQDSLQ